MTIVTNRDGSAIPVSEQTGVWKQVEDENYVPVSESESYHSEDSSTRLLQRSLDDQSSEKDVDEALEETFNPEESWICPACKTCQPRKVIAGCMVHSDASSSEPYFQCRHCGQLQEAIVFPVTPPKDEVAE